jgi:TolB-like protein
MNKKVMSMKAKPLLITILVLVLIVVGYFLIPKLSKSSKPVEKSIAVLPFANESPSDSNRYFINGVMEEILNNLQKTKDFKVLSRTSVEPYRNTTKPIAEIGRNLGVTYIVEGSGQKFGNTYNLKVQLIDTKNNKHVWAKSYEKEISNANDIYSVQTEISQAIANEIKALITP